ncbi:tRNA 2-thiouridine(34) synthase MnmA [Rickettsiales bacterium]|nr:tRNA 2-thiouridine(34) synthase MnmA [Rickettsiales bacterium]
MTINPYAPEKSKSDTKLVVAMSGGVDSSVVAAMLHKEGYDVIGATMQLYDHGVAVEKKGACCAGSDIYDAKRVAEQIGFPHYILNYEDIFKEEVIEEFADSYLRGETPIPCVKCNQSVKFRDMFKVAKDLGADALVTGHYVQKIDGKMHKGADPTKDQSYFLFATTKEQLEYVHFPLGGLHKEETRKLAEEYGLKVANKPDSQDICFVPDGSYAKIVEKLRPGALCSGEIIHVDGKVIGTHDGIINYTIGQRKGLGIGWHEPLYVVRLDARKNQVIVGPEEELGCKEFRLKEVNWLGQGEFIPDGGVQISIKSRSTQNAVGATIYPLENDCAKVILDNPQRAITSGQACVFYDNDMVLGGGWIVSK